MSRLYDSGVGHFGIKIYILALHWLVMKPATRSLLSCPSQLMLLGKFEEWFTSGVAISRGAVMA